MRGTVAKGLRNKAAGKAVSWYIGLLPEAEEPLPSFQELYSYVVDCDHVKLESSGSIVVSQNTKRRFYLDEKKLYANNYIT